MIQAFKVSKNDSLATKHPVTFVFCVFNYIVRENETIFKHSFHSIETKHCLYTHTEESTFTLHRLILPPDTMQTLKYLMPDKSDPAWSVLVITQLDVCEVWWAQCCQGNVWREGEGEAGGCEGGVWDDPSHSQESLETLSAVAAHLCLLILVAGGGREGGGRGGCRLFLGVRFLPPHPFRNPLCTHGHTHIWQCGGLWHLGGSSTTVVLLFKLCPSRIWLPFSLTPSSPHLSEAAVEWMASLSSPISQRC